MPDFGDDPSAQVRIYGRLVAKSDDGHLNVLYCGFQAGVNDVRVPSARVFHLKRAEILDEGDVPGFEVGGEAVRYYELPLTATVFASQPQQIDLSAEVVRSTGGTFATLVGTPPMRPALEPSEELMVMQAEGGGGKKAAMLATACNTYRQSYSWTWDWTGPHPDPWGADCD